MKDISFRIKTEQELVDEFGKNWGFLQNQVAWVSSMNEYFGRPIPYSNELIEVMLGIKDWIDLFEHGYIFSRMFIKTIINSEL